MERVEKDKAEMTAELWEAWLADLNKLPPAVREKELRDIAHDLAGEEGADQMYAWWEARNSLTPADEPVLLIGQDATMRGTLLITMMSRDWGSNTLDLYMLPGPPTAAYVHVASTLLGYSRAVLAFGSDGSLALRLWLDAAKPAPSREQALKLQNVFHVLAVIAPPQVYTKADLSEGGVLMFRGLPFDYGNLPWMQEPS